MKDKGIEETVYQCSNCHKEVVLKGISYFANVLCDDCYEFLNKPVEEQEEIKRQQKEKAIISQYKDSLVEEIEKKKASCGAEKGHSPAEDSYYYEQKGYNQALSDVMAIIKGDK